jgi:hypothetical protein
LFLDEFLSEEGLVELGREGEVAGNVECWVRRELPLISK